MKTLKTLFLFFFIYLISICSIHAQNQKDSVTYYADLIKNHKNSTELTSAYTFFRNHKEIALKENNMEDVIYDLTQTAIVQNKFGDVFNSQYSAIEALKHLKNLEISNNWTDEIAISLYNHLGVTSKSLLNYKRAIYYYNELLEIVNTPSQKARVIGNIGSTYLEEKEFQLAIDKLEEAYKISLELNEPKLDARLLDNLGFAQWKLNLSVGLTNMEKALKIRIELNYIQGIITSYLHISEYYSVRNKKELANEYVEKALALADSSKNAKYKVAALSALLDLKNDPRHKEYKILTDSIKIAERTNKNQYSEAKYNLSEKDEEIKKSNRNKRLFKTISAFILLVSIFLYFLLKSKQKKETLQQVINTESRISKKIHDEVANDVYHVMTKLQSSTPKNSAILDDLENIYTKTRDISKENSAIDVHENFDELLSDLLLSYKNHDVNVITRNISKIKWNIISNISKITIYRVLQELMTNMRKHSNASLVVLTFSQTNTKIAIDYNDNGIGGSFQKNTGLQNVENRIKTINGTITFESEKEKGFKVKITI